MILVHVNVHVYIFKNELYFQNNLAKIILGQGGKILGQGGKILGQGGNIVDKIFGQGRQDLGARKARSWGKEGKILR